MMSTNDIVFIERGLPLALTTLRNIGVSASAGGDHWSAAAGVYGDGIDEPAGSVDQGYGASGRATFAPVVDKTRLVHVGGSLAYRALNQNDSITLSSKPESNITDIQLADTGAIDVDDLYRYGLEGALMYGPVSLQGEYIGAHVYRVLPGLDDLDFNGYYVEASWFPTGESLNYSAREGIFKSLTPNRIVGLGGIGAWQLAVRFSSLDLNDADIRGGDEDNMTFGLNWYATPNLRFMADYIHVLSVDGGASAGDEPGIFAVRGQLVF
jgi:phosphate-selective porin OprO/OprP